MTNHQFVQSSVANHGKCVSAWCPTPKGSHCVPLMKAAGQAYAISCAPFVGLIKSICLDMLPFMNLPSIKNAYLPNSLLPSFVYTSLEAYVWRALGQTHAAAQQPDAAQQAYRRTLALFTDMGVDAEVTKTTSLL